MRPAVAALVMFAWSLFGLLWLTTLLYTAFSRGGEERSSMSQGERMLLVFSLLTLATWIAIAMLAGKGGS